MNDTERFEIAEMLDKLTIEKKREFLQFLRDLQAQEERERQRSANADAGTTTQDNA